MRPGPLIDKGRPARESSDELGGGGRVKPCEGKPIEGSVMPIPLPSPYMKGGKVYE
jgi:hypothetical protein